MFSSVVAGAVISGELSHKHSNLFNDAVDSHRVGKVMSCFEGTGRSITVFKKCHHLTLFRARGIQFTTFSFVSILILSSHLHLNLPDDLFP